LVVSLEKQKEAAKDVLIGCLIIQQQKKQ